MNETTELNSFVLAFLEALVDLDGVSAMSEEKVNLWKKWMPLIKNNHSNMSEQFVNEVLNHLIRDSVKLVQNVMELCVFSDFSWKEMEMIVFLAQRICSILAYFSQIIPSELITACCKFLLCSHGLIADFQNWSQEFDLLFKRSAENITKALNSRHTESNTVSLDFIRASFLHCETESCPMLASQQCGMYSRLGAWFLTSGWLCDHASAPHCPFVELVDLFLACTSVLGTVFCGALPDDRLRTTMATLALFAERSSQQHDDEDAFTLLVRLHVAYLRLVVILVRFRSCSQLTPSASQQSGSPAQPDLRIVTRLCALSIVRNSRD